MIDIKNNRKIIINNIIKKQTQLINSIINKHTSFINIILSKLLILLLPFDNEFFPTKYHIFVNIYARKKVSQPL